MKNQRIKFSLPKGTHYLNCAYMSPLLRSSVRAGIKGLQLKEDPSRILARDFYEDTDALREAFAQLVGIPQPNRVVVIPSASYGMANVVRNVRLSPGDNIILTSGQFPSNYYPWQRLCNDSGGSLRIISPPDGLKDRGRQWNERILTSIDRGTKVVTLGHVHWTDGTKFGLELIRKRTRDVGSLLIIDGTQSIGAMPFDFRAIDPDALICAGYKWLLGPYSIGLAYYGEFFDNGVPIEENWINRLNSEDFQNLVNYQERYQPGVLRYEVGEHSNFTMIPMLLESIRQIRQWKPEGIQRYCDSISKKAVERLREEGFWVEDESHRGKHIFGIRFPKSPPSKDLAERLRKNRIFISFRGDSIRVSPHVYNSANELDHLAKVMIG